MRNVLCWRAVKFVLKKICNSVGIELNEKGARGERVKQNIMLSSYI